MGAEHATVAGVEGRKSVRIESKTTFTEGLFVLSLSHMPTGCGTWPVRSFVDEVVFNPGLTRGLLFQAFWMCGADPWPVNGEIDIIEGVDTQSEVFSTLHTDNGCDQGSEGSYRSRRVWPAPLQPCA
jgi:hypothetical protein